MDFVSSSYQFVLREALSFLYPLTNAFSSLNAFEDLVNELGFELAPGAAMPNGISGLGGDINTLIEDAGTLFDAGEPELSDVVSFMNRTAEMTAALAQVPGHLSAVVTEATGAPGQLFQDLLDNMLYGYLRRRSPGLLKLLHLLAVIELEPHAAADRGRSYLIYRFNWAALGDLFRDSGQWARTYYKWGGEDFDSATLLSRLGDVFDHLGLISFARPMPRNMMASYLDLPDPPSDSDFPDPPPTLYELPVFRLGRYLPSLTDNAPRGSVGVMGLPAETAGQKGLALIPYLQGAIDSTFLVGDSTTLNVTSAGGLEGGFGFKLFPNGLAVHNGITGEVSVDLELQRAAADGEDSIILFGAADATRLQAEALLLSLGGSIGTSPDDRDFYIAGGAEGLSLIISPGEDGLLSSVLSDDVVVSAGDLLLGWRLGKGIYFESGGTLGVEIPLQLNFADVLRIHRLGIEVGFADATTLSAWVNGDLTIGPLFLGAEGLGINLSLEEAESGLLGNYDIDVGLRLPTGYAAALTSDIITGGGALFKTDDGYRGALSLKFQTFGLSAFGILTTKMPDGAEGFSFLVSIFGEFEVQLGYGFILTGLGGIIGVHRTADVEALRDALYAGNLNTILFPPAPIEDASLILNTLDTVFPARQGQYLFGPAAKLAWGTGVPLIEGKIAVILELGEEKRLVILGAVGLNLPNPNKAIIALNLDFLGVIDFTYGRVSFDAALTHSTILTWPVSGEMAMRTGWGPDIYNVVSFGGFHPAFDAPANVLSLQRMSINFGSNNPQVTITAYQAVTANSFQMGANLTIYAKGPEIFLLGQVAAKGWAGFDALIYFNPFRFDVHLYAGLELLIDGSVECGINADLKLTGPNSYYISGKVWITVFGLDVKIGITHRWGGKKSEDTLTANPLTMLLDTLGRTAEMEAVDTAYLQTGVSFAASGADEATPIDPVSGLRFVQRALPLNTALQKLGEAQITGPYDTFDLIFEDHGGAALEATDLELEFVRGQYFDLSEDEKLRGEVTRSYKGGVEIHGGGNWKYDADDAVSGDFEYEIIPLGDDDEETASISLAVLGPGVADRWMNRNFAAVAREPGAAWLHPELTDPVEILNTHFVGSVADIASDLVQDAPTVMGNQIGGMVKKSAAADVAAVARRPVAAGVEAKFDQRLAGLKRGPGETNTVLPSYFYQDVAA